MSFLQLSQVSKFYGDLCVVANMNLAVEKGEFISLLGPSGCGKTTTLQRLLVLSTLRAAALCWMAVILRMQSPIRAAWVLFFRAMRCSPI